MFSLSHKNDYIIIYRGFALSPADNFACDCVAANNRKAVRDSVAMMLGAGHRDIGALFGDDRNPTSRQRLKGYEQAFRDYGLPAPSGLVRRNIVCHEGADAAARDLLAQGVTALYTTDIVLTVGALKCLQRKKRRIPGDIAMFGWGDCKWTELTNPPLTVMRHPNRSIGRKAAEILLKRISGQSAGPFRAHALPAEIIRRESF